MYQAARGSNSFSGQAFNPLSKPPPAPQNFAKKALAWPILAPIIGDWKIETLASGHDSAGVAQW